MSSHGRIRNCSSRRARWFRAGSGLHTVSRPLARPATAQMRCRAALTHLLDALLIAGDLDRKQGLEVLRHGACIQRSINRGVLSDRAATAFWEIALIASPRPGPGPVAGGGVGGPLRALGLALGDLPPEP